MMEQGTRLGLTDSRRYRVRIEALLRLTRPWAAVGSPANFNHNESYGI